LALDASAHQVPVMTLTWADAAVTLAMILAAIAIVWLVRHW
jgi:hypothetical protein